MVDMESDEEAFLDAIRAGVVGYVLKNASAVEVAAAIRSVAAGRAVCPPSLCLPLFRCVMHQSASPSLTWGLDLGLSRREQEILELLRYRYTNKEIALRLNLSEQTVKNHVHHVLRKLKLPNRFGVFELYQKQQARRDLHLVSNSNAEKPLAASIRDLEISGHDRSLAGPDNLAMDQD
jgi:DNA-binding NarL/FixJ family response regulator